MRPPAFLVALLLLCVGAEVFSAWRVPSEASGRARALESCEDECGCPPRPVADACCCEEPTEVVAPPAREVRPRRATVAQVPSAATAATRARSRFMPPACGGGRPAPAAAGSSAGPVLAGGGRLLVTRRAEPGTWCPRLAAGPVFDLRHEPATPPPRVG